MTIFARAMPWAVTVLILTAAPGAAQLSPGPLARAHQELDGALSCFKCHTRGGSGSMTIRCLDCHGEVAWTIEQRRGLHGQPSQAAQDCAHCHPDHAGRDLDLVRWDEGSAEKFAHGRTGWTLEGAHTTQKCRSCHRAELQRSPAAALIKRGDHAASWLGLETSCASCHDDAHRGQLGSTCDRCHDAHAWKPAPGFDHGLSSYPLTGKHLTTACAACHLRPGLEFGTSPRGGPMSQYKPLAHGSCSTCHQDPHRGGFGPSCAGCHTTEGFRIIRQDAFDHRRTRYPLIGRHAAVACADCHDPRTAWGPRPAFAACTSCHRDPHAGQATIQNQPVDCAACHEVEGFRHATFTVEQHAATSYPLAGRHANVTCGRCHGEDPALTDPEIGSAAVRFRPDHERCADCHDNPHGHQLEQASDSRCESCHDVTGFKPSRFTKREHARLSFALAGRHAEIACTACHGAARPGLNPPAAKAAMGSARFAFSLDERECASCHTDPHGGRFAAGAARHRSGCQDCHSMESFHPATMDVTAHATSGFPLEGAHRAVACQLCHRELEEPPPASTLLAATTGARKLRFEDAKRDCSGCHSSPHGDQFATRRDGGACDACHGLDAFTPATRFDHNRDATFRLEGAHARVVCAQCHRSQTATSGRTLLVYRPLSGRCESCHAVQSASSLSPSPSGDGT